MDITLIAIISFILISIVFLLIFLYKNINKKSFTAEDGSVFDDESDLALYQKLYEKTKPLFFFDEDKDTSQLILGFEKLFLKKLISDGFQDLKTLVKYRKQFKSLFDLINT